jgi:hypothetical protein
MGGIVSPASSIPRYVDPQMTYTAASATHTRPTLPDVEVGTSR